MAKPINLISTPGADRSQVHLNYSGPHSWMGLPLDREHGAVEYDRRTSKPINDVSTLYPAVNVSRVPTGFPFPIGVEHLLLDSGLPLYDKLSEVAAGLNLSKR